MHQALKSVPICVYLWFQMHEPGLAENKLKRGEDEHARERALERTLADGERADVGAGQGASETCGDKPERLGVDDAALLEPTGEPGDGIGDDENCRDGGGLFGRRPAREQ